MMLPLTLQSVRWTAVRSLDSRKYRSMAEYLVGYLAPWLVCGAGVVLLLQAPWAHAPWLPAAVFAGAGLWAATPMYDALMQASHRNLALAPSGWRADIDCVRFGALQGLPCVATCGMLMVGCTLTGHGPVAMLAGAALGMSERLAWQPRRWWVPAGCCALAAWYGGVLLSTS